MNRHVIAPLIGSVLAMPLASQTCPAQEIEEVVVTAQKRESTVLDTPATVDVLATQMLQEFRINDLQSLNRLVPGFQFEMGAGGNMTLAIRGVGTTSSAQSFEQSVSPYIDGIYLGGNNRDFSWPLFDLERIEVLKGTQSGIAGQNTSVGVVNIVTRKPGDTLGGYAKVATEFLNQGYSGEGALDVPFSDTVKARFTGYYKDWGGWIHNRATGHDLGESTTYAGRVNLTWAASDRVNVHVFGEYDHMKQIGSATAMIYSELTSPGGYSAYVAPFFNWKPETDETASYGTNPISSIGVGFGGDSGVLADTVKGSATIDVDVGGGYQLTSVTSASRVHDKLSVDQDFSQADVPSAADPTPSQWLAQNSSYQQLTEELRLTSPQLGRFNYLVGLWYRYAVQDKTTNIYITPAFPAPMTGISWPFKQTTNNASVFADANFKILDNLTLGGTARYTDEDKAGHVQGNTVFAPNATFPAFPRFDSDLKEGFLDGSVRLKFEPTAATSLYALWSHGTKTGALVDLVASGQPQTVKPEVVQMTELGAKTELLDRSLTLNVSLFKFRITDYQDSFTAAVNGTVLFVASNSDVRGNGADIQMEWRPSRSFRLGASAEHLDAENETFGGRFVRSPKWQLAGNVRYDFPLFGLGTGVFANVLHKDDYFQYPAGQANRLIAMTPAYTTADFGVDVAASERLTVRLLCKNCTDEHIDIRATSGQFGPTRARGVYAYFPELRTVTLEGTYNF